MAFMRKFLNILKLNNKSADEIASENELNENELSLTEILQEIDKAKRLADTINTTIDRQVFLASLFDLKDILRELTKYEGKYDFNTPPSKDLEYLEKIEKSQIELLEKRIEEATQTVKVKEKEQEQSNGQLVSEVSVCHEDSEPQMPVSEIKQQSEQSVNQFSKYIEIETNTTECDCFVSEEEEKEDFENVPYRSKRLIVKGLHLYFIDIAREIVNQQSINIIPLMREYNISEDELSEIIKEIQDANIIDSTKNVLMSTDEFEKFIDIYEPSIFECRHSVFDKEIFMVIGEIIFDRGIEDTYNSLPADEVIDYLNIMEKLKIIAYDDYKNKYDILIEKNDFDKICESIPNSFSNTNYSESSEDYINIDFDNLSGIEFEKYCAYVLLQNGYDSIKITPPSGDHGIDILTSKDEVSYAIQCKCYSDNVGNAAVQQAHTGKSLYHKDIAVVMTNRYFTAQAIEEAKTLGVKLWDRDKLNEMIETKE